MAFTTSLYDPEEEFGQIGITPEGIAIPLPPQDPYGPTQAAPPDLDLLSYAHTLTWQSKSIDPTGLIWLGARYYNPKTGRFLSPDPLGALACLNL